MKNITKYALFCGCILALSACGEKQLGAPEVEIDESAPIGFAMDVAGTKGLIETQDQLDNTKTVIKVFDYVSGSNISINGQQGGGLYIDDTILGKGGEGAWAYGSGRTYYWTKTGTHKFYGWLSVDGNSATDLTAAKLFGSEPTINGQKLVLPSIEMTPASTQLDFLYSDIQSYTMPARPTTTNKAVPLKFYHLFTALAINIVNETGVVIPSLSLSLSGVQPTQSAEIDFSAQTSGTPSPVYTVKPDAPTSMELGTLSNIPVSTVDAPTQFFPTDEYRLLWPQTFNTGSKINVTFGGLTYPADLSEIFENNKMEPGKKYLLTITIKLTDLRFTLKVDPLTEHYYGEEGDDPHTDYLIKL